MRYGHVSTAELIFEYWKRFMLEGVRVIMRINFFFNISEMKAKASKERATWKDNGEAMATIDRSNEKQSHRSKENDSEIIFLIYIGQIEHCDQA